MNLHLQPKLAASLVLAAIVFIAPTAALIHAADSNRPMQSHDFVDVPVAGKEFMEPYIDEFFHQGITGGCSASPMMYCPEDPVTRGSLAVFMGRALGYVDAGVDAIDARAYFKTTELYAAGVAGNSTSGSGVFGMSESGAGVAGISPQGFGVEGRSLSGDGVRASSTSGDGVDSRGGSGYGVRTVSSNNAALMAAGGTSVTDTSLDTLHDIQLGGNQGEIASPFGPFLIESVTDIFLDLDYDNNDAQNAVFRVRNGTKGQVFLVYENGDMVAAGSKSAIVDTVSHGTRLMYAVEATENWFEDFGTAELVDGEVVIEIDPIFAETVNLSEEYHVFAMPVDGWADLYIAEMTESSFTVRSADGSDVEFSYRIVGKRLGYEDVRMEEFED